MPEDIQTGGLMRFKYSSDSNPQLSDEKKREIREAYARADERKRKEKKNKIIMWIVIALIIIVLIVFLGYYFLK